MKLTLAFIIDISINRDTGVRRAIYVMNSGIFNKSRLGEFPIWRAFLGSLALSAALAMLLALVAPTAVAQGNSEITKPPVLPKLEPLPEPPPPPPGYELDPKMEPQVVKIAPKAGERERNEYRINGKLYMIRVVPEVGVPYFLIDDIGQGNFVRYAPAGALRVPQWVIFTF
jgi:hypothetical protein